MCRSKRKRIIKKWLKNPRNYIMEPLKELIVNDRTNSIHAHPSVIEKLKFHIKKVDKLSTKIVGNDIDRESFINKCYVDLCKPEYSTASFFSRPVDRFSI